MWCHEKGRVEKDIPLRLYGKKEKEVGGGKLVLDKGKNGWIQKTKTKPVWYPTCRASLRIDEDMTTNQTVSSEDQSSSSKSGTDKVALLNMKLFRGECSKQRSVLEKLRSNGPREFESSGPMWKEFPHGGKGGLRRGGGWKPTKEGIELCTDLCKYGGCRQPMELTSHQDMTREEGITGFNDKVEVRIVEKEKKNNLDLSKRCSSSTFRKAKSYRFDLPLKSHPLKIRGSRSKFKETNNNGQLSMGKR
ncbi:hypothetical protein QYF36_001242 [Acer negundo]|nr:hypothetical protein QYF36_001242 [Acer negundo]